MLDTMWTTHVRPVLRAQGFSDSDFRGIYRKHLLDLDAALMGLAKKVGEVTALCAILFPVPPPGTASEPIVIDDDAKFTPLELSENDSDSVVG